MCVAIDEGLPQRQRFTHCFQGNRVALFQSDTSPLSILLLGPAPPKCLRSTHRRIPLVVLRLVRLTAVDRCKGSHPIPDARPYRIARPDQVLTGRQAFECEEAIPIADGLPVDEARHGNA
jgi:hypothetical protein